MGFVGACERVELEQHTGEHLSDLVVETARDPQPLGLLRTQRPLAALPPLGLEPVEHLVERAYELCDLDAATLDESLPGPEEIDRAHPLDQPVDRFDRMAKEKEVGREHDEQCQDEIDHLDERDRRVDRHRSQREQDGRDRKQRRVDREDPPDQR